jgi:uncharacterized membrane protein YfcA
MDPLSALAVCAAALCVGLAVGATGIGGVLLIPALWLLAGVPVREAMGTVLAANAANGALAAFLFARRGSIDWRIAAPLAAGALVFAFAGGTLNAYLPAAALVKLLGVVMAAGCAYAYFAPAPRAAEPRCFSPSASSRASPPALPARAARSCPCRS